ncbi:hypothetical protein Fmac_022323 [Flemingia macrophylla]|uniref:TF-B3 domain-containing protein n=1 Tax=Flemingia macrophylla TaxID=520843 RepID=A0ABD1LZH5_9FABA
MTTGAKKHPDFFKVYLPEQSSERLLIPNAFVRLINLQGRIPEDVILRNCSGRVWHVKTRLIGEKLYFDDGWKVFREENCLGKADFLVFEYDGCNEFKVLILEVSTQCEKPVVKMEEEENENVEEEAEAQQVDEMEVREEEEHEQVEEGMIEDEEDSEDEDYDSDEDDDSAYDNVSDEDSAGLGEIASSYAPRDEGPLEVYEYDPDMYIQPENPYFEAKLYKSRRNELHIPGNVIKDFCLTFTEKVTLFCCGCCQRQDIQENELRDYHLSLAQHAPIRKRYLEVSGEVCRWLDGRVCVKGWLSFCRRNKMTRYDTCLCEIISDEDQIVRMFRVHVVGGRRE